MSAISKPVSRHAANRPARLALLHNGGQLLTSGAAASVPPCTRESASEPKVTLLLGIWLSSCVSETLPPDRLLCERRSFTSCAWFSYFCCHSSAFSRHDSASSFAAASESRASRSAAAMPGAQIV